MWASSCKEHAGLIHAPFGLHYVVQRFIPHLAIHISSSTPGDTKKSPPLGEREGRPVSRAQIDTHLSGELGPLPQGPGLGAGVWQGQPRAVGPPRPAPALPGRPAPPARLPATAPRPALPPHSAARQSGTGADHGADDEQGARPGKGTWGPRTPHPWRPSSPETPGPRPPLGSSLPSNRTLRNSLGVPTSGLPAPDPVKWLAPFRDGWWRECL